MGVNPTVIDKYTVYSIDTAMEMSKNILYFMVTFIWGIIGVFLYVVTNKIAKKKFGIYSTCR